MDLMHLVQLVVPWKQREQRNHFEHDTANTPQVHLVAVEAVGEETLGRTVPTSGNVLSVGLFRVDAAAGAKIGQFDLVFHQKDVLGLDVPVENTVTVHVIDCFHKLVHVVLDALFRQVVATAFDGIVHVHFHELEYEGQTSGRLIVKNLVQLDYLWVRGQPPQSLNLTQVVHLWTQTKSR